MTANGFGIAVHLCCIVLIIDCMSFVCVCDHFVMNFRYEIDKSEAEFWLVNSENVDV